MADLTQQINEARKGGYSDEEIAGYLGKSHPELAPKFQEAARAGYKPAEILSHLSATPAPAPERPRGQVFWETIGGQALQDMLGGASRDPAKAQKALDTFKGLVHGIADEPARVWGQLAETGAAMTRGDIPGAASHLGGAVPFIGGTAREVQHDVEQGDYGAALERTAGMVAPFVAPKIPGIVSDAGGAVVKAAKSTVGKVAEVAANPVARELIGVVSPRLRNALALGDRLKTAVDAARAAGAPPESLTPGQILAQQSGADWAKLSPSDQAILEHVAKAQAQANAATQQPRPPMGPPQAPPEAAPVVQAPPPPAAGPISQVQQPVAPGTGAPQPAGVLQFPTRTPAMGEQMPAPEVQTSQMASQPTAAPVEAPAVAEKFVKFPGGLDEQFDANGAHESWYDDFKERNAARRARSEAAQSPPEAADRNGPIPDGKARTEIGKMLDRAGVDFNDTLYRMVKRYGLNLSDLDQIPDIAKAVQAMDPRASSLKAFSEAINARNWSALEDMSRGVKPDFIDPVRGGGLDPRLTARAREILKAAGRDIPAEGASTTPAVEAKAPTVSQGTMPAPEVQTSQMASEPTAAPVKAPAHLANRAAMAQRFAKGLQDGGVTSEMAKQIQVGHLGDSQMQNGMAPRWGNVAQLFGENVPSESTIAQIIGELKKLEAAKAKRAPGGGMGAMRNYFVTPK